MKKTGRLQFIIILIISLLFQTVFTPVVYAAGETALADSETEESDQGQSSGKPTGIKIPYGGDLGNYQPDRDGYYAYLPVCYEDPSTKGSDQGTEKRKKYVKTIIFEKQVLIDVKTLAELTGIGIIGSDTKDKVWFSIFQRQLLMEAGVENAYYYMGTLERFNDNMKFQLNVAPQLVSGELYVPLLDVLIILQIPYYVNEEEGKSCLNLFLPKENAYDVLTELWLHGDSFLFDYGSTDLSVMKAAAEISDTLHKFLVGDRNSRWALILEGSIVFKEAGEEILDRQYCEDMILRILSTTEEECGIQDEFNLDNADKLVDIIYDMSDITQFNLDRLVACIDSILKQDTICIGLRNSLIDSRNEALKHKDWLKGLENYKFKVAKSGVFVAIEIQEGIKTYKNKDLIANKGLDLVFDDENDGKLKQLDEERIKYIKTEKEKFKHEALDYSINEWICNNLANGVTDVVLDLISFNTGLISNGIMLGYMVVSEHLPVYGSTLNAMENFMVSLYTIPLQKDVYNVMSYNLCGMKRGYEKKDFIKTCTELAYFYLKTCYTARDCGVQSIADKNKDQYKDWMDRNQKKNKEIARMIAVLADSYTDTKDTDQYILPPISNDLAMEAFSQGKNNPFIGISIPLYTRVSGSVINAEDNTPVEDALCEIKYNDDFLGTFTGTPEGRYAIYVPMSASDEIIQHVEDKIKLTFSMRFSSPTVPGTDKLQATWQGSQETEVRDAYLGNLLKQYLDETLIPKYGLFRSPQKGTMGGYDDRWLKSGGIINATIRDFDLDGKREMLVFRHVKASTVNPEWNGWMIQMEMYEAENNEVVLADWKPFMAYHEPNPDYGYDPWIQDPPALNESQCSDMCYEANTAEIDGKCYILCGQYNDWHYFSDGRKEDYWAMMYQNNKLQYAFSFSQSGGGSDGFAFTGYEFTDGERSNEQTYYNEEYEYGYGEAGLYRDKETAMKAFFHDHGLEVLTCPASYNTSYDIISLNSVYSTDSKVQPMFLLTNQHTKGNSNRSHSFKINNDSSGEEK